MNTERSWLGARRHWAVLAGGFAAGFVLLNPHLLYATTFWRRIHASACHTDIAQSGPTFIEANDGAGVNTSASSGGFLYCPVPDDTNLPRWTVTTVTVNGFDANPSTNVTASACITLDAAGGSCNAQVASSGTGAYVLHPLSSVWNQNGAPYVFVILPTASGTSFSKLSYVMVNN